MCVVWGLQFSVAGMQHIRCLGKRFGIIAGYYRPVAGWRWADVVDGRLRAGPGGAFSGSGQDRFDRRWERYVMIICRPRRSCSA